MPCAIERDLRLLEILILMRVWMLDPQVVCGTKGVSLLLWRYYIKIKMR